MLKGNPVKLWQVEGKILMVGLKTKVPEEMPNKLWVEDAAAVKRRDKRPQEAT